MQSVINNPSAYVAAALKAQCRRVSDARIGQRNHVLFGAAADAARLTLIEGSLLTLTDAREALCVAASDARLRPPEYRSTIRSGLARGLRNGPPGHLGSTSNSDGIPCFDENGYWNWSAVAEQRQAEWQAWPACPEKCYDFAGGRCRPCFDRGEECLDHNYEEAVASWV
jgi:hypothetical protein